MLGKGCVITMGCSTFDEKGTEIIYNEFSNFIRGVSGIGSKKSSNTGSNSSKLNNHTPPANRQPDKSLKEKTFVEQAALYRLSGDSNPIHIDPQMSSMGGFEVPIIHGLCTFGIACKHLIQAFGNGDSKRFNAMKVKRTQHLERNYPITEKKRETSLLTSIY